MNTEEDIDLIINKSVGPNIKAAIKGDLMTVSSSGNIDPMQALIDSIISKETIVYVIELYEKCKSPEDFLENNDKLRNKIEIYFFKMRKNYKNRALETIKNKILEDQLKLDEKKPENVEKIKNFIKELRENYIKTSATIFTEMETLLTSLNTKNLTQSDRETFEKPIFEDYVTMS